MIPAKTTTPTSRSRERDPAPAGTPGERPRVWACDPEAVHDRFWASRAVQVVRTGQRDEVQLGPALYLLLPPGLLTIFNTQPLTRRMAWIKPAAMRVRLEDRDRRRYGEHVECDDGGGFVRVHRDYRGVSGGGGRAVLTADPKIAKLWSAGADARSSWRAVCAVTKRDERVVGRARASLYRVGREGDVERFLETVQRRWKDPGAVFDGVYEFQPGVWLHETVSMEEGVRFAPPVWVGAGVSLRAGDLVAGPAALPDEPGAGIALRDPEWAEVRRDRPLLARARRTAARRVSKRAFDVVFSLAVLAVTLPLYPLVIAMIFLEDGWPPFFAHRRQTIRGREFPCIKFRTMRKDAERLKAELAAKNQADGPQFYIPDDPRLLKCGKLLRKLQIDEFPQFINVLLGHMSVVGPRPSPDKENQFCPAWREARLSVRPGVTGLWQVRRTREPETDFQEWIRYDLEYVQRQSWRLDIWIIVQTVRQILKG